MKKQEPIQEERFQMKNYNHIGKIDRVLLTNVPYIKRSKIKWNRK